jgi:putative transposase
MKKSRFTEEQIVSILRETDWDSVPVVAKRYGVSEQTIYVWKKRFGSFQPDDVRRLKQLEQENARLKKLVAERDLEIEVMKEIAAEMVSVPTRREQDGETGLMSPKLMRNGTNASRHSTQHSSCSSMRPGHCRRGQRLIGKIPLALAHHRLPGGLAPRRHDRPHGAGPPRHRSRRRKPALSAQVLARP